MPDDPAQPERPEPGGFCNYPGLAEAQTRERFAEFLDAHVKHLWPRAVTADGHFDWDLLVSAAPDVNTSLATRQRVQGQFVSANVNPSDRFTLTLPGSTKFRISPLDDTYDNLTVVGDWTACGFNESCVEAAVMSGRLGAHAISGSPRLGAIVGYDHP